MLRRLSGLVALLLLAFGLITWFALEWEEVVVLHTQTPGGEAHTTRVWIADEPGTGAAWVEAASPERPFYQDVLAAPVIVVERDGQRLTMVAAPVPGPEGHARIRDMLRAKYGLADAWINLIVDTSRSVAVRLAPVAGS